MKDNLNGFQKLVSTRWTFSISTVETPNLIYLSIFLRSEAQYGKVRSRSN